VEPRYGAYIAEVSWIYDYSSFEIDTGSIFDTRISLVAKKGSAGKTYIHATVMDDEMYSYTVSFEVNIKPPSVIKSVSYPNIVGFNTNTTFSVSLTNSNDYEVAWNYDNAFFDFVFQSTDRNTIILKAKKIGSTHISIEARSKLTGSLTDSKIISVKIEELYKITPNKYVICANENISYGLSYKMGEIPPNSIIIWQAGQNMTLVSGQGTPNAIFKGNGNGIGKVKATVSYDGQTFEIENSDVWVGPPAPLTSLTGFEQGTFAPNQRVYIGAMSLGAIDYMWNLSGDARFDLSYYQGMAIAPIVTSVPTGQGMFTIEVYAKNQCGRSNAIRKSGIVNGTNSGDPTPPMVEKSGTVSDVTTTPVSIRIYNFNTGSVVYQKKNVVNFNIQDTGLNDGIYIVETIDSKGNRTSNKVFKKKQ